MAFLSAKDEAAVKHEFERIGGPVKLTVFATVWPLCSPPSSEANTVS